MPTSGSRGRRPLASRGNAALQGSRRRRPGLQEGGGDGEVLQEGRHQICGELERRHGRMPDGKDKPGTRRRRGGAPEAWSRCRWAAEGADRAAFGGTEGGDGRGVRESEGSARFTFLGLGLAIEMLTFFYWVG